MTSCHVKGKADFGLPPYDTPKRWVLTIQLINVSCFFLNLMFYVIVGQKSISPYSQSGEIDLHTNFMVNDHK